WLSVTRVDPYPDRHPRSHQLAERVIIGDRDLDRYPLHHLGEIAGGIVRRQQAELGTGSREQAVDVALYRLVIKGIKLQGHRLASAHALYLGFLEVGLHPQVTGRHDRQQVIAGLHVLADAHAALANPAGYRSVYPGTGQIDLGALDLALR